jgi:hypothetical protein
VRPRRVGASPGLAPGALCRNAVRVAT